MPSIDFDILILGSGPSGVQAAREAVLQGAQVGMVDAGMEGDPGAATAPARPFRELRRSDHAQHAYFLGKNPESVISPEAQAGAQLTPAREYVTRGARELLPTRTHNFEAVQSLAMGGLGAAWGAGCARYEADELNRIGIPADGIGPYYEKVAAEIGVSGPRKDDISAQLADLANLQDPLQPDSNAQALMATYLKKRDAMLARGFSLGRPVMAVLTRPLGGRKPNPYHDMDFWNDAGESVWRPRYALRDLGRESSFAYLRPYLAERFEENQGRTVSLHVRNLNTHAAETIRAKRLILAAGAINSGRLVLRSAGNFDSRVPILSNPYAYLPTLNLPMLGKPAEDRRHSLVQLSGVFTPGSGPEERLVAQFYSYRSLLLFRLAKEMPLPPSLAMMLSRCIADSLVIVAISHADLQSPRRWMTLKKCGDGGDILEINSGRTKEETSRMRQRERQLLRRLVSLKLMPLNLVRLPDGASIHYAGTLPFSREERPLHCDAENRLWGTRNVFVADSSSWNFLPAKGLTFTLMANARRIAERVARALKESGQ